jgi:hypothetical protein
MIFLPLFLVARAFGTPVLKQELPIQIGASEADVFESLGHPAQVDSEWIYNDADGDRQYYIEFTDHRVTQVKATNFVPRKKRLVKLVNGLTFQDGHKKWSKVLGKASRVVPSADDTTLFWKFGNLWVALSIDPKSDKNDWFWIVEDKGK